MMNLVLASKTGWISNGQEEKRALKKRYLLLSIYACYLHLFFYMTLKISPWPVLQGRINTNHYVGTLRLQTEKEFFQGAAQGLVRNKVVESCVQTSALPLPS